MLGFHKLGVDSSHFKILLLIPGLCLCVYLLMYTRTISKENKIQQDNVRNHLNRNAFTINQQMCEVMPNWVNSIITPKIPTILKNWEFKNTIYCPRISFDNITSKRQKVSINCKIDENEGLITTWTNYIADIDQVQFGDKCLEKVIDKCCKDDDKPVPNVVHYVWTKKKELSFFNFVSFMSALRFMKPCLILIHGDSVPYGKYWDYFFSISPNILLVNRTIPTHIFGNKIAFHEHSADVMRIEALLAYGGVYLDIDQLLLRPLDPLRKYKHTQAYEVKGALGNNVIISEKNAQFLQIWYDTYRNYKPDWSYNSLQLPAILAENHPHLINVDGFNFTRPDWATRHRIFKGNYDWSTNQGLHLFVRYYKNETTVEIIRTLNSTIGAVCRHVLFGNKEICMKDNF